MVEIKLIMVVILLDFALISVSALPMNLLQSHRFYSSGISVCHILDFH